MQREQQPTAQIVCYLLVLLAVYLLNTVLPMELFGFRLDLILCVPAAVALMEGPYLGLILGFAAGVCYDMAFTGVEGLYPIYFMIFGVAAGLFADRFLRRIFASMLLLTVTAVLGLAGLRLIGFFIFQERFSLVLYVQQVCGEALVTAVLSPVVYFPIRQLYRRFR